MMKRKTPAAPKKRAAKAAPATKISLPRHTELSRVKEIVESGGGILRLAPTWVPRSFLTPGSRLKLARRDLYALGVQRGGINERWLASTTSCANPDAPEDEGLSDVVVDGAKVCSLRHAISVLGPTLIGPELWERFERWPVMSKLFDNQGPIPFHLHQTNAQAALVGQQGKSEAYYFPPQLNTSLGPFPYTFFGLDPTTSRADLRQCLKRWDEGDNGVLELSRAYQIRPGTGWFVPAGLLHAPGTLATFETQWGSDVFAIYQSMVEDRSIPWHFLVKDVPADRRQDVDYLVEQIDWEANLDPNIKEHCYLEPIATADAPRDGVNDRWVIYGRIGGQQLFSAKELTVAPGARVTIKDSGAYGLIAIQGNGWIGKHRIQTPTLVRFGDVLEDEVFVGFDTARQGVVFDNTGCEPLVTLRYFGPDANPGTPEVGAHRSKNIPSTEATRW